MSTHQCCQIKQFASNVVDELAKNLYNLQVLDWKQLNGYDDKNFYLKKVVTIDDDELILSDEYVLKITNEKDSKVEGLLEAQTLLLLHVSRNGLKCPEPVENIEGKYLSLTKIHYDVNENEQNYGFHMIRLMKFIPGKIIANTEYTVEKLEQVGHLLARFHLLASDFYHPAYENYVATWSLLNAPHLKQIIHVFDEENRRDLLHSILDAFENQVVTKMDFLSKGLLHGDFNEQNILVDKDDLGNETVVSFLDVGDSHFGPYVFDVGLAIMYMMLDGDTLPLMDIGGHILRGYVKHRLITCQEFSLLKLIICTRLCQSLTLGMFTYKNNPRPENTYVLTTQKKGWPLLESVWHMNETALYSRWNEILSTDSNLNYIYEGAE